MNGISVITVCYNSAKTIRRTLDSVCSQTGVDLQFIVVDGSSTDGTLNIINEYSDRIDSFVSEVDKGIYDAMNKGLALADREWVFFLNSGDVFADSSVLSNISFPSEDISAVVGNVMLEKDGRILSYYLMTPFFRNPSRCKNMGFSHQATFVRTPIARSLGFDCSYKLCADFNMMMQLHKRGLRFMEVESVISIIDGNGGASASNRKIQLYEEMRVCGCEKSLVYLLQYYLRCIKFSITSLVSRMVA